MLKSIHSNPTCKGATFVKRQFGCRFHNTTKMCRIEQQIREKCAIHLCARLTFHAFQLKSWCMLLHDQNENITSSRQADKSVRLHNRFYTIWNKTTSLNHIDIIELWWDSVHVTKHTIAFVIVRLHRSVNNCSQLSWMYMHAMVGVCVCALFDV